MAKACLKKDLHNLENEIEDLIMLEDSARGTLCAIHKTIHSTDNFPCTQHKMMRLCSIPRICNSMTTRIPLSRCKRKSRSSSPNRDHPKMCRTLSAEPWQRPASRSGVVAPVTCPNYVNLEKTISCPEKMCCQNIQPFGPCYAASSKSSVRIDKFAQSLINTDEVVSELKGEIERVKHQLHHISQQKLETGKGSKTPPGSRILQARTDDLQQLSTSKLKNENKRLKREVEAKRKLLEKSRGDVEKAKEILLDYEKKVGLLHVQALKSSKAMRLSKEKFCGCLQDREDKIKTLKNHYQSLEAKLKEKYSLIGEKEMEISNLTESLEKLKISFEETSAKCSVLTETNQNFYETIEMLQKQLLHSSTEINTYKETVKKMEQKLNDLNNVCKKVTIKTKKQKEMFDNRIKADRQEKIKLSEKISELSLELEKREQQKRSAEELECKCKDLQGKIEQYENYSEKCKGLEEELKELYGKLVGSEKSFKNDKEEMRNLILELTAIVHANQTTIAQMTDINKQQENLINKQSVALLTKEEQLKLIEKESENFKLRNSQLEMEVEVLRKSLSEPCSKEACICVSSELEECRNALNVEKDTKLLKEKIIQDQSQTILNLQSQVKEKMFELNKAQSDTTYLEEEIGKINEKLIRKHKELDREVDEKENLIEKLRVLECQKNQLNEEICDFEGMLQGFKKTCGDNEKQRRILIQLEKQITEQKCQWDVQKESMAKEKKQAVCAAKFATQKLLDTVADFQRQVDAQKKVQILLTKMLHEKDQQLRIVTSKISNINTITRELSDPGDTDLSMKELFCRKKLARHLVSSDINTNTNTNTSMYSSCSSCCKRSDCVKHVNFTESEKFCDVKNKAYSEPCTGQCATQQYSLVPCAAPCQAPCIDTNQILKFLSGGIERIQEEPSRDPC